MLRSFLRLFSKPTAPQPIPADQACVTMYARMPAMGTSPSRSRPGSEQRTLARQSPSQEFIGNAPSGHRIPAPTSHRERVLSMRLEHTRLCRPQRAKRLAAIGIVTAGDLAIADPDRLSKQFGAPRKAARILRQYRRAIRFAATVPGMMPRDAMLLVSIHRRSARSLAIESPGKLHRDLERFAQSSQGQSQLRGRRLPSNRRLKLWISQCNSMATQTPSAA